MAVFVPLANGSEVIMVYILDNKVVTSSLWFTFDNPPFGLAELNGLAAGVYNWHTTEILPFLSNDLQLVIVEAFDRTIDPPVNIGNAGPLVQGGTLSPSYSANVALRINLRWPLQFRERKNCNFVPGIPDSAVTLNTLDPTFANRMWSAYADLIDATRLFSPAFNWRWVVTSRVDGGLPRVTRRFGECIGPVAKSELKLAQRRKRLP